MAERTGTGVVNYCSLIKNEGERLLKLLKDSNVGSIQCKGWDGIGRWRIAEYAANKAMESNVFDVLIWVYLHTEDFTPRNVQMKIAESLGIQRPMTDTRDNFTADHETSSHLYQNLKTRNFLLVVGSSEKDLGEMDLVGLGVPDVQRRSYSKVVWVGELGMRMKCDRTLRLTVDIKNGISSASEVWDLLYEESALVANSLRNLHFFSSNVVMDWIAYLALFHGLPSIILGRERLLRFYIAEGIINGGEMGTDEEVLLEATDQLQQELMHRSILLENKIDLRKDVVGQFSYIFADAHHGFWRRDDSLPKEEDDDNHGWGAIQRLSWVLNDETINLLPPAPNAPKLSTIVTSSKIVRTLPPTIFQYMRGLKVLDLSFSQIESLPSSLSSLGNLRLLMLRKCRELKSLPSCLRSLQNLEFLDLSNCDSLEMIPEESFELMDRLRVLDASGTRIRSLPSSVSNSHNLQKLLLNDCRNLTEMPEDCFERMLHLRVLKLSNSTSLKSLPSSLSNLVSLKILDLSLCKALRTGVGLQSLQNLSSLEVLDLSECNKLEDIRDVSFQHILSKLRRLKMSEMPIPKRLLFRGHQSIKWLHLSHLENLEVLHLIGCTKLEELNLTRCSLKRLDILPMENFSKVDVLGKDERCKVLNWGEDDVGARIWLSNFDFFKSILKVDKLFFRSECFSQFYICISPHGEELEQCMPMTMIKIQNIHLQRSRFLYKDIYYSQIHTQLFPHSTATYGRCLEISGGDGSSPTGLEDFLAHTELVILFNNNSVERLSDLCNATELMHLRECQIGSCQGIETLFFTSNPDFDIIRSLEVIQASDLPKLITVCSGDYGIKSFTSLKHIFLQHCPKLETLFTSTVHLQSLETLEIKCCCKLKNIFGEEVEGREGSLPSLRHLYLFHVPKLKSICNGGLPHLKMLQVHRCPMLRKLPFQVHLVDHGSRSSGSTSSSRPVVEIRGELEWWKNLKWGNADEPDNIKCLANFRPWRRSPATMQKQH